MSSYYRVGIIHGDNVRCRSSGANLPLVAKKMGFRNKGGGNLRVFFQFGRVLASALQRSVVSALRPQDDPISLYQSDLASHNEHAVTLLVGD